MPVNTHLNIMGIGGRFAKKPEFRRTKGSENNPEGSPCVLFTIANNTSSKKKDQTNGHTNWVDCVKFGSDAEEISAYDVGDLVSVYGFYNQRDYEKDGVKKRYHSLVVTHWDAGKKPVRVETPTPDEPDEQTVDEDDMPID